MQVGQLVTWTTEATTQLTHKAREGDIFKVLQITHRTATGSTPLICLEAVKSTEESQFFVDAAWMRLCIVVSKRRVKNANT